MTHIKNMLKYLLITIMALSLLAVSCTKDGTPPPTPTNPITIDAATLDSAIQKAVEAVKFTNIEISFVSSPFKSEGGKAIFKSPKISEVDLNTFKTELESALKFSSDGVTFTATAKMPDNASSNEPVTVTVVIDAGNNTFADDVKTAYNVTDKKATVVITIKPLRNWDGTVG